MTGNLAEIWQAKAELLEEWRDLLKRRTVRQAQEIGQQRREITHLRNLLVDVLAGKYDDQPEALLEDSKPKHPEVLDAEWTQPGLLSLIHI